MKTLYFVSFSALLVASVTAKFCYRDRDCEETECCIDKGFFRKGECKPLAKEGEKCNELDARIHIFSGKYVEHCPCEKGLYCEPSKTEEEGFFKKVFKDMKCTTERRETVRPTRKPRPTRRTTEVPTEAPTEAPVEEK